MRARWIAAVLGLTAMRTLAAQSRPAGPDSATRRALALAYLRVELANRDHPIPPDRQAAINLTFDRATLAFFTGSYQSVIGTLDSIAGVIEGASKSDKRHHAEAEKALDHPSGEGHILGPDSTAVSYRVYVPARAPTGLLPVVVALHGAGTTESAFLDAYGAGHLRLLADSAGFLIVAPFTNTFMRSPDNLARLLADVETRHPIDRRRIYLLGHSLGAMTAWRLAQERPEAIAGVVAMAGAGAVTVDPSRAGRLPRTLVFGASVDSVVPVTRLAMSVEAARAIGWAVEYRELPNRGHTLMVGAALPAAIQWLFEKE
jgi:predicted esterase